MNKFGILIIVVLFGNCTTHQRCDFTYTSSAIPYCATGKLENGSEDGKFIFWRFDNSNNFDQAGFYFGRLRNDDWFYRINDNLVTIKWGAYKDSSLHFETNVFSYADTLKHGDSFAKFQFKTKEGPIQLTIGIDVPMKDSFPEGNYERIAKNELASIGYEPLDVKKHIIGPDSNKIYIYELKVKNKKDPDGHLFYLKNAFARLGKHFIDFSVKYDDPKNYKGPILFEGVLTNFFLRGERLYNPISNAPQ
jgi:hypothetical protein